MLETTAESMKTNVCRININNCLKQYITCRKYFAKHNHARKKEEEKKEKHIVYL